MTTVPPSARATRPSYPDTFELIPWNDPLIELVGFPPHHAYVELLWLPVVGPSGTWLYRRLWQRVQQHADGTIIDLADLAASIGLGRGTAENSPIQKALDRVVRFGLARWDGRLAVRTSAPPLACRQLGRLSPDLQAAHQALVDANRAARHPGEPSQ